MGKRGGGEGVSIHKKIKIGRGIQREKGKEKGPDSGKNRGGNREEIWVFHPKRSKSESWGLGVKLGLG